MQYVKIVSTLLFLVGSYAQADTQATPDSHASVIVSSSDAHRSHADAQRTRDQQKSAKTSAERSQPKVSAQSRPYQIPLSDYNNGGHFGN